MKWFEVDWSWYIPEDTVFRPTEIAAFNNLDFIVGIIKANGTRVLFTDIEWDVLIKDLELRRKKPNATIKPVDIASRLNGFSPKDIDRIQRQIDAVMLLRDYLGLPILPPVPKRLSKVARQLKKVA